MHFEGKYFKLFRIKRGCDFTTTFKIRKTNQTSNMQAYYRNTKMNEEDRHKP